MRNRNFILTLIANFVSNSGNYLLYIALPVYVYNETGSPLNVALVFVMRHLPSLLSPLAGTLADSFDRKRLMVVSDVACGVVVLCLLPAQAAGGLWVILIVSLVLPLISQLFMPALVASIPNMVPRGELVRANATVRTVWTLGSVVGSLSGGAIMLLGGISPVVLLDSASFLISAALLAFVTLPPAGQRADVRGVGAIAREVALGFVAIRRSPLLTHMTVIVWLEMFAAGPPIALLSVFLEEALARPAAEFGFVHSVQQAGALAASLGLALVAGRLNTSKMVPVAMLGLSLCMLTVLTFRTFPVLLACYGLVGAFVATKGLADQTIVQVGASDEFRGRVYSIPLVLTGAAAQIVSIGVAGVLASMVGTAATFYFTAFVQMFAAAYGFRYMWGIVPEARATGADD